MPKTRMNRASNENVTASHSDTSARHIRTNESDAPDLELAARIKELVGDETKTKFAKACGFSEGMLRKYLKGAQPRPQYLANMANYRNVDIQWLATGTGFKSNRAPRSGKSLSSSLVAMQYVTGHGNRAPNGSINGPLLSQCLQACGLVHGENFTKALLPIQIIYAADFYNQLIAMSNAKTPPANIDDFSLLDMNALADQLRFFLQMKWARPFPFESDAAGTW